MALAPRITVEGTGGFAGTTTNVATYSATEDATPVLLGSTSGGTGQLGFSVVSSDTVAGDPQFAWVGAAHASPSVARFADSREVCNAVPNPVLGTNANGWSTTGANVVGARYTSNGLNTLNPGHYSVTWSAAGTGGVAASGTTVIPGQAATASIYVKTTVPTQVIPALSYAGVSGGAIGTPVSIPANQWVRVSVIGGTVPTGATTATISATTTMGTGATLDATLAQLTPTTGTVLDIVGNLPPVNPQVATSDLLSAPVRLVDGSNGTTRVTIATLDDTDGVTAVTADSRLGALLATRTAKPMQGTPEDIFRYYLTLGGITTDIQFLGTGRTNTRAVQGWTGVVWDFMREFAISVAAEIALVSGKVVIRPLRQRVSVNRRDSSVSVSRGVGEKAQAVEVVYYSNSYKTDLVYPTGGWTPEVEVYQVDPEEIFTTNIPVTVSPTDITQPVCVDYVPRRAVDQSVYSVVGADGLAIKPAQWAAGGGSVKVAIGEDNRSLDLTIVGANTTQGPFRIAVGAGPSDVYSSLRILGTGTFFTEQTLRINTGLTKDDTPQEVGVTVESTFISSRDQAYDFGMRLAQSYAGFEQTMSASTVGINRLTASGALLYPRFSQFDNGFSASGGTAPSWVGKTFSAFDATWAGTTFDQFNAYYIGLVEYDYGNQAFGNVAGSRVLHKDVYYRIDSATLTESGIQYQGSYDTLFGDFSNRWSAQSYTPEEMNLDYGPRRSAYNAQTTYTFADFNAMMVGKTFRNFNYAPLWRLEGKYRPAA